MEGNSNHEHQVRGIGVEELALDQLIDGLIIKDGNIN